MSAGSLCRPDKQNTAAAYFTTVPYCQAVYGKKRVGSKHNEEFDTLVCFQLLWLSLFSWKRFIKTV